MRNIPVDTSGLRFLVAGDAVPRVADPSTGEVKTDAEGRTLYAVPLLPIPNDDHGRSIRVSVAASERPSLTVGEQAAVSGLTVFAWQMNGRSGLAFRAESVSTASRSAV